MALAIWAARATTSLTECGAAGTPTMPRCRSMTTRAVRNGSIFSSTTASDCTRSDLARYWLAAPARRAAKSLLARDRFRSPRLVTIEEALDDLDEVR